VCCACRLRYFDRKGGQREVLDDRDRAKCRQFSSYKHTYIFRARIQQRRQRPLTDVGILVTFLLLTGLTFVSTIVELALSSFSMSADTFYSLDVVDTQAFVFMSALGIWR
jgi:hypothetical protein